MKLLFFLFILNQAPIDYVINQLKYDNFSLAESYVFKKKLKENLRRDLISLILLKKNIGTDKIPEIKISKETHDLKYRYLYYLNNGLIEYHHNENAFKAYDSFFKSLEIAKSINNKILICESIRNLLNIYLSQGTFLEDNSYKDFFQIYKENIFDEYELISYNYYKFKLHLISTNFKNANKNVYNKLKIKLKKNSFPFLNILQNMSNASYHFHVLKNIDSAFYYLNLSRNNLDEKIPKHLNIKNAILLNQAKYYLVIDSLGVSQKILNSLKVSKKGYLNKNTYTYFLDRKWSLFKKMSVVDSTLIYANLYLDNKFLANLYQTKYQIADIKTKYKTEKKEKQILIEKQKNKTKQNLLVGSILVIILGGIIGTLSLKNSKRKRKLAEQQKELETQKNLALLKEQEITTINAMVDGQEKERKRIAEDLHDNLGSVLATLKLHFENLKINREKKKINQEELFNKTETLIDEAYLKVRRIAHAKNAGVIANEGLLLAVQMMAEKISSADKIKIEVTHFGLDKPLENNLEITVFRIIQELVTNILKHAEATKASINISLYDKNLNIIIEDNGKGFDTKKVNLRSGMGLSSIKTRIEYLQGNFQMDATIGKGSSMIIDIPLL